MKGDGKALPVRALEGAGFADQYFNGYATLENFFVIKKCLVAVELADTKFSTQVGVGGDLQLSSLSSSRTAPRSNLQILP